MDPLISTILEWERRLELGHQRAYLARRYRFKDHTSPAPANGPSPDLSGGETTEAADLAPHRNCGCEQADIRRSA